MHTATMKRLLAGVQRNLREAEGCEHPGTIKMRMKMAREYLDEMLAAMFEESLENSVTLENEA